MTLSPKTIHKYKSLLRLFCQNENLSNYNKVFIKLHYKISEKNQTFISKETIRSCLSAILWYLKTYYPLNLTLIRKYSILLTHMRISCTYDTKNHLNVKTNIPIWNYFEIKRQDWLIKQNYKKHLVSCVYTMIPPRRLLDYSNMIIIKDKTLIDEYNRNNNEQNYYCYDDNIFAFCYYKTRKVYNTQIIDLPIELDQIIKNYIKLKNINIGESLFGVIDFEKLVQKTFNCGVNAIRHSYVSNFYNNNNINHNKINNISTQMGHSIETNIGYYKNIKENPKKITTLNKIYKNPRSLKRKSEIKIIFDNTNITIQKWFKDCKNKEIILIILVIIELLHKSVT